jgi:two-component system nitrate/nitrite response regulator NarL
LLLGSRSWAVFEAESGWAGVRKFKELRPDVVVLDLAMPELDGIKTAQLMSGRDPTVPIILFTIFGFDGVESSATKAGITAIVPKNNAWSLIPQIERLAHSPSSTA